VLILKERGAVISPILLNIYVKDLLEKIVSQRCKFADDSAMWKSRDNLVEVSERIQKNINFGLVPLILSAFLMNFLRSSQYSECVVQS
jgi:hypothetical protein